MLRSYRNWFLVIFLIGSYPPLNAASLGDTPKVKTWYESLGDKRIWPENIAFVKQIKKDSVDFLQIDPQAFEKETFLKLRSFDNRKFTLALNIKEKSREHVKTWSDIKNFAISSNVDTIVVGKDDEKRWAIYKKTKSHELKKILIAKKPESTSSESIRNWFVEKIGFSGSVLAIDGKFVLAACYKTLNSETQVMMVKNSASLDRLDHFQQAADGLLRLIDRDEDRCLFELVMKPEGQITRGVKLIF